MRYLASGGVNTLLSYLLYLGLRRLLDFRLAYVLAFAAGVLLSYGLLRHMVFARAGWHHALPWVAATHLLQLALGLAGLGGLVACPGVAGGGVRAARLLAATQDFYFGWRVFGVRRATLNADAICWLRRLCVALPLLMPAANLLAWLRWCADLPFLPTTSAGRFR
ncbi:MAG: GtrA family protein [Burkholderiaceae bacterium]|nr:GtrA family protein [Burkholderiaceae bacterium]